MKNTELTNKIMFKVAQKEESHLTSLLKVALPAALVLFLAVCFTAHRTVVRLVDRDFLTVAGNFQYGQEYLTDHLLECSNFVWREAERGFLVALLLAFLILIIVITKTDLPSFPRRFRQIKKYIA